MIKKIFLVVFTLFSMSAFSQVKKDSIVSYLDYKGNKTQKTKARYIQTLVKKNDLWVATTYFRNGKIRQKGAYLDKKRKKPFGSFINFHKNGKVRSNWSYNSKSKVDGINKYWFDNGQLDRVGNNKNGKRIGVWKYYYTNGKNALREYYDNGKVVKRIFFDENEHKMAEVPELIKFQKPTYKGKGLDKFFKELKGFHDKLPVKLNGIVIIDFTINEQGKVVDVDTSDNVSDDIKREFRFFLKNIEGWKPAISMNRKTRFQYSIPFKFKTEFR